MTDKEQWKILRSPLVQTLARLRKEMKADLDIVHSIEPSDEMKAGGPVFTASDRIRLDAFNRWQDGLLDCAGLHTRLKAIRKAEKSGANPLVWKLANG